MPDGQLEQRTQGTAVVEHGSVHYTFSLLGEVLEVGVVGSDNTCCVCLVQVQQYTLGYGSANQRLGTRAELVNQEQGCIVGILDKMLHVPQM